MTTLELLFDEAKMKRTESLRHTAFHNAKAEAFKETMDSIEKAIDQAKEKACHG